MHLGICNWVLGGVMVLVSRSLYMARCYFVSEPCK
jgi:hypothetical protein